MASWTRLMPGTLFAPLSGSSVHGWLRRRWPTVRRSTISYLSLSLWQSKHLRRRSLKSCRAYLDVEVATSPASLARQCLKDKVKKFVSSSNCYEKKKFFIIKIRQTTDFFKFRFTTRFGKNPRRFPLFTSGTLSPSGRGQTQEDRTEPEGA